MCRSRGHIIGYGRHSRSRITQETPGAQYLQGCCLSQSLSLLDFFLLGVVGFTHCSGEARSTNTCYKQGVVREEARV